MAVSKETNKITNKYRKKNQKKKKKILFIALITLKKNLTKLLTLIVAFCLQVKRPSVFAQIDMENISLRQN